MLSLSIGVGSGVGVVVAADEPVFQQSSPEASNDSRHEHPDEADEEGDLSGMRDYLSSQLASRLGQSSVEISQGEYDQAREHVGDDYDEQLSRYVEIAEETDSEADEETAREFEEAAQNQREFANSAEEYETTYEEYQEAVEAGDDERARELARELERQSGEVDESGAALEENYGNISESTSEDLSEERRAVEEERQEVRSQQAEVRELEFVGTEIQVESATEQISFTEPLELEGRLVTETGEPIADREVTFAIGEQTVTTTTDSDGAFSLTYRPTALPLETTSLEIEYQPVASSEYARSSATVPVSVTQSEPTVTIETGPQTAAFGDETTIAGSVGIDGVGAAGVPVVVSIGDERIGEAQTDADGTFELTSTVPGTVASGDGTIIAALALEEQALAPAETAAPVTIEETDTRISMTATETDDGDEIAASGRLATADGRAIPDQPIRILVDGTAVATVETNDAGEYEATLDAPPTTDGTVEVTAVYDSAGTNFAESRTTDTVAGLSIVHPLFDTLQRFGPAILLAGVALILLAWDRWRRDRANSGETLDYGFDRDSPTEASANSARRIPPSELLELARENLSDGETDRAIRLAYVAVRSHFATTDRPGWTHWEFYNEAATRLEDRERDTLLSITEQFERAVFTPISIPENAAVAVIAAAERLITDEHPSRPSAQAAD